MDKMLSLLKAVAIPFVLSAIAFAVIMIFGVPGVDPSLWDELAVTAQVRPPQAIFPGMWRILVGWMFSAFGIGSALSVLKVLGAAVAALCVFYVYSIIYVLLPYLIRTGVNYKVWRNWIVPGSAALGAVIFMLSDPLWRVSSFFSPDQFRLVLFLGIVYLMMRWLSRGSRWRLFPLFGLMGVMAAETPFAFILPPVCVLAYYLCWGMILDDIRQRPEKLDSPDKMPKWRMFFCFLGGLALAIYLNVQEFISLGGLEANAWSASDIYFRYGGGYWRVLAGASSIIGWVLGLGFGLFPLVAAIRIFPLTVRDDRQMPFNFGVMMFFVGSMAVLQTGIFPAARFWTFTKDILLVHSGFLLNFYVFCSAVTVAMFAAAFTMECQRKYLVDKTRAPGPLLRYLVPFISVLLVAGVVIHVDHKTEAEVQRIVEDAVNEIVTECGDAEFIFTDGRLDSAIELKAKVRGLPLKTLNMMSGPDEYDVFIRSRHFVKDSEDFKSAETGVPALLRIWAGEKPHGMDKAALQLGFEFWRREQKPLPTCSGMVAREKGMSEKEAKEGIERSKKLSKRILDITEKAESADCTRDLSSALSAVSWRLARFARLRNDEELANTLDLSNSALKKMLSIIEYERLRTFMQLTPREGLQLALKRADFTEARRYSAAVLRYDEDDPEANFGMGMSSLQLRRYEDAERYMKRVLKRRPDEPAALNNLSIIARKLKHYDEAISYAQKAIKLLPDSKEVQKTLSDALKKAP